MSEKYIKEIAKELKLSRRAEEAKVKELSLIGKELQGNNRVFDEGVKKEFENRERANRAFSVRL